RFCECPSARYCHSSAGNPLPLGEGRVRVQDSSRLASLTRRAFNGWPALSRRERDLTQFLHILIGRRKLKNVHGHQASGNLHDAKIFHIACSRGETMSLQQPLPYLLILAAVYLPTLTASQARRSPMWFEGARLIIGDRTPAIESSAFLVE